MNLVSEFYQWREPLRRSIRELARAPDAVALDVGCKHGDISRALVGGVRRLVAVDRFFHSEWCEVDSPVRFAVGDARALPFPASRFDVVVASECLQYIEDPLTAIDEFHRVLKPGGKLIMSFPQRGPVATFLDPYNLVNLLKNPFRPRDRRRRFVRHHHADRLLEQRRSSWEPTVFLRRGTPVFIYTAWLIDKLQAVRVFLLRRSPPSRLIAGGLRLMILGLFKVMTLDFSLSLNGLAYNNIIGLRKPHPDGERVQAR